jgi:hypothetical protein
MKDSLNKMAVSFCRRSTMARTASTGSSLTSVRRSLIIPSWLQLRMAPNCFFSASSQMTMSTIVSASVQEFGRGTHTIEFAPLAAVEETTVAKANFLERLDFLDLMLSVRMKDDFEESTYLDGALEPRTRSGAHGGYRHGQLIGVHGLLGVHEDGHLELVEGLGEGVRLGVVDREAGWCC